MDTILVVDDSPVVRRVLSLTLESAGYVVLTADDGIEAQTMIQEDEIDLVFCDIHMPVMNGIELLQTVRPLRPLEDLPIVMLTASGDDDAYKIAIDNGANSVLTKPASSHEVISTAKAFLSQPAAVQQD